MTIESIKSFKPYQSLYENFSIDIYLTLTIFERIYKLIIKKHTIICFVFMFIFEQNKNGNVFAS